MARQIAAGTTTIIAASGKCPRIRGQYPRLHEGDDEGCDRIELVALRDQAMPPAPEGFRSRMRD
jgi:hypothetical protein